MKKTLAASLIVASSLCFTGCTSMRVIADNQQALSSLATPQQKQLKAGDKVSVKTNDGKQYLLSLSGVDQQGLEGKLEDGNQNMRLPWQSINEIQLSEVDGWKTAGLVALIAGLAIGIGASLTHSTAAQGSHIYDGVAVAAH
ncbi:hypothetical protein C2134_15385 [Chromobacterium sinusclupearum]|uniref:Lipoprotein n=1 Tax=Chromobacterium sinusclupearum TaxID=2077146 RepID=A0A2K4MKW5_9NEIS|nr:hypothetical protein [Chromobacterium sinusclupearum]POA97734.1 hypothetical protein C2134_15385 [Chromobacterium sinusclupearum]